MALDIHSVFVPSFIRSLGALKDLIDKAESQAATRGQDMSALLDARLVADMYPLRRQIGLTIDHALRAVARLSGAEAGVPPSEAPDLAEIKGALVRALDLLRNVPRKAYTGAEAKEIVLNIRGKEIRQTGLAYLTQSAIPNFYFHFTTAYGILRANGFEIGKLDFLGKPAAS